MLATQLELAIDPAIELAGTADVGGDTPAKPTIDAAAPSSTHAPTPTIQATLPVSATESASADATPKPESVARVLEHAPALARASQAEPSKGSDASPPSVQGIAELRDLAASVEAKPAQPAAPDAAATERAERILEQLKLHLATRGTQATLELHPEHLGHIAIKLSMHKGKLRAELSADNVDTLAALQRHAPELRTMLEVRGVQPESFDFRLDLERHDRRPAEQDSSRSRSSRERAQGVAAVAARSSTELRRALADAWGVDTYA